MRREKSLVDRELAHFWLCFTRIPADPQLRARAQGLPPRTATVTKILPSDRAQLKLPGLPRTRKPARTPWVPAYERRNIE
ncbi:hypothetical protein CIW72_22570 (plasmid) [Xanthomonas citri pv. malvacearum]|nr:hypothetical protein CIW72_22570 [Xanthomonas citri pv. malvacearum]